jgi:hypothetical protein
LARKETAKQRRQRKERERAQQAAYERGDIPAALPKSRAGRARHEQARREMQREYSRFLNRSGDETSLMTKEQVRNEVFALHDIAYDKFRALMQQGTPTAGTSKYITDFAGINVDEMTIDELRAYASKFRKWLKRKDIIPKRALNNQNKQLKFLRSQGITDVKPEDLDQYFDLFSKYRQLHKGYSIGSPEIAKAFAAMRDGNLSMKDALFMAEKEMGKTYERNVRNAGFSSPLDIATGVQPAKPSQLSAWYRAGMRMDTTPKNRKQRRQAKKKRR